MTCPMLSIRENGLNPIGEDYQGAVWLRELPNHNTVGDVGQFIGGRLIQARHAVASPCHEIRAAVGSLCVSTNPEYENADYCPKQGAQPKRGAGYKAISVFRKLIHHCLILRPAFLLAITILSLFVTNARGADGYIFNSGGTTTTAASAGTNTVTSSLASAVSAGATAIVATAVPSNNLAGARYVFIEPYSTNCEIREISSTSGSMVNIVGAGGGAFPLKYDHVAGTPVLFCSSEPVPLTMFGAVPDVNTTATAAVNVTAFNRLSTNLYLLTLRGPGHIYIPPGTFYINGELRPERDLMITGQSKKSIITAHSSFDFSANSAADKTVAMFHWMRDGVLTSFTNGGPFTKMDIDGLVLDGAGITNSVGMLCSPQQPSYADNMDIRNCDDGLIIAASQLFKMRNWLIASNRRGVRYRAAKFVWAYDFDFQQNIEKCFDSDTLNGAGDNYNNHFIGLEVECNATTITNFTFQGNNWQFKNVWFSNHTNGTGFKFIDGYVGYPVFTIEGLVSSIPGDFKVIEDVPRGISRTVDDVNRHIQYIESGLHTPNAWSVEITGSPGGQPDPPPQLLNGVRLSRRTVTTGAFITAGSGSPEGVVVGDIGSIFIRTNGGAATTLYIKESGTSTTGWVGK